MLHVMLELLHITLGCMAIVYAINHEEDRPYAQAVGYIVATDLVRWLLLWLLPWQEGYLFPVVDLLWISHYGAHAWMAKRIAEDRRSRVSIWAIIAHGTATAAISAEYVKKYRWMGRYSLRHSWIRFSGAILLCLAFAKMIKAIDKGDRRLGLGLGLAATVLSMMQILHHPTEIGFHVYQTILVCYMVVGTIILGRNIFKERRHA
jgi:hypothetical protein